DIRPHISACPRGINELATVRVRCPFRLLAALTDDWLFIQISARPRSERRPTYDPLGRTTSCGRRDYPLGRISYDLCRHGNFAPGVWGSNFWAGPNPRGL